jgi:hypothetical protein
MGGVDSMTNFPILCMLRKSVKLWKTLLFHLFNILLVNTYSLHRKYQKPTKYSSHQTFRQDLVHNLFMRKKPLPLYQIKDKGESVNLWKGYNDDIFQITLQQNLNVQGLLRDSEVCNPSKSQHMGYKWKQTSFCYQQCDIALRVIYQICLMIINLHFSASSYNLITFLCLPWHMMFPTRMFVVILVKSQLITVTLSK